MYTRADTFREGASSLKRQKHTHHPSKITFQLSLEGGLVRSINRLIKCVLQLHVIQVVGRNFCSIR